MNSKLKLTDIFQDRESHKTVIKVGLAVLLFLETFIYLGAYSHSGPKSWVAVYDKSGDKIYEAPGSIMTRYERRVVENTYGPLSNYQVRVHTRTQPFPFRAWLAIAVATPIGLALLLIYLLRAYLVFASGENDTATQQGENDSADPRKFVRWFGWKSLSIYHLGIFVVLCVLAIWLIPDLVADAARGVLAFVVRFKWFFLTLGVFLASVVLWMIYLRYKLSIRAMDSQMDLEKFKIEKNLLIEGNMHGEQPTALPEPETGKDNTEGAKYVEPAPYSGPERRSKERVNDMPKPEAE